MTIDTIRAKLAQRPFEAFRIVTSSGQTHDVRHPDAAILYRTGMAVAYGARNGGLPEHVATISLLHISSIKPLPPHRKGRSRISTN